MIINLYISDGTYYYLKKLVTSSFGYSVDTKSREIGIRRARGLRMCEMGGFFIVGWFSYFIVFEIFH